MRDRVLEHCPWPGVARYDPEWRGVMNRGGFPGPLIAILRHAADAHRPDALLCRVVLMVQWILRRRDVREVRKKREIVGVDPVAEPVVGRDVEPIDQHT